MPNDYSGIKKVRQLNGDQFIIDFHRHSRIYVNLSTSFSLLEVKKGRVWRLARDEKVPYRLSTTSHGMPVMIIY